MQQSIRWILSTAFLCLWIGCTSTSHRSHPAELHDHDHEPGCGHIAVRHDSHVDYLHDGHLHYVHGDHVDEHVVPVSKTNPDKCSVQVRDHQHGPNCGHPSIPHGDHIDYLIDGRLHHPHDDHCDDHGEVEIVN